MKVAVSPSSVTTALCPDVALLKVYDRRYLEERRGMAGKTLWNHQKEEEAAKIPQLEGKLQRLKLRGL